VAELCLTACVLLVFCYGWQGPLVSHASMEQLFLFPSTVTLSIASTRLYRSLTNFPSLSSRTIFFHLILLRAHRFLCRCSVRDLDNTGKSARSITNSEHAPFRHVSTNQLDVTVHRAYEEYPMKQTNHCDSYPSSDVQLPDKPREIKFDDIMEGRAEK